MTQSYEIIQTSLNKAILTIFFNQDLFYQWKASKYIQIVIGFNRKVKIYCFSDNLIIFFLTFSYLYLLCSPNIRFKVRVSVINPKPYLIKSLFSHSTLLNPSFKCTDYLLLCSFYTINFCLLFPPSVSRFYFNLNGRIDLISFVFY